MNAYLRVTKAHVWCVSTDVIAACVRNGSIPQSRVHLLPYGPDTRKFRRDGAARRESRIELGIPSNAFVAANVSRFHPVKRLPMFIEAVEKAGCIGAMAVSASFSTWEERRAHLEWARSIEARQNVVYRLDSDPWPIYLAADVIVSTSTNESLGVSLLEGMASGIPVVCTAVGGVQDFLLHQRNSIWIPGASVSEVAAAIQHLMTEAETRANMGFLAEETVRLRSPKAAVTALLGEVR